MRTSGFEYWNTAPDGHSKVMKNTNISRGTIHTMKLFKYQAHECNQLSNPISIIASYYWTKQKLHYMYSLHSFHRNCLFKTKRRLMLKRNPSFDTYLHFHFFFCRDDFDGVNGRVYVTKQDHHRNEWRKSR